MNVLAITAFSRPELLQIYLNQILKDKEELERYLVYFFLDFGYNKEIIQVIDNFSKQHKYIKIKERTIQESQYSLLPAYYNITMSYLDASKETDDFVIIGEEDIIPTNDYLRFNRIVYEKFLSKYSKIFCVAHKRRPETEKRGNIKVLIGDYQITSPSCISKYNIEKYMAPHLLNSLFHKNPIQYNYIFFNNLRIYPNEHFHHDGEIERIAEFNRMFSLKPDQARSMHIGIGGQHDKNAKKIEGSLQEKVNKYYELINNPEELRSYACNISSKNDLVVTDLDNEYWDDLELDIERNMAKASSWWYDINNEFRDYIKEN